MGYIDELRQLMGSRPLIMVGAGVIILDEHNRILLTQRSDNIAWSIPGGAMEPGETLEDVARRETQEEVGLQVGETDFYGVFSGPELYYRYPNGDQVYNVTVVYVTRQVSGKLKIDEESQQARYFPLHDLPEISPRSALRCARFWQKLLSNLQEIQMKLNSNGSWRTPSLYVRPIIQLAL